MIKVAAVQLALCDQETRADRFLRVEQRLEDFYRSGIMPDLVMLPEMWATGFINFHRYTAESEPLQGETFTRLAPWAEKLGCYFLAGSFVERDGQDYFNTSLLLGPDGSLAGSYRKVHLFGYQSRESEILTPGSEIVVVPASFGKIGLSTCYDLRFPELYRKLMEAGAEILLVPAAWPMARLEHWVLFNRARALENLCYLVSCNCSGSLGGAVLAGNSMAVNPWGEVVARSGESEAILTVELDPAKVPETRRRFPVLEDRRI
ncbi:MAG TPA: carbon-nitrogen family hydrolase [Bacillota bacterium]|nr:carbon-nitrogen family hydrolase [Bacillota bacterium]